MGLGCVCRGNLLELKVASLVHLERKVIKIKEESIFNFRFLRLLLGK